MTDDIHSLIGELESNLSNNSYESASTTADALSDKYDAIEPTEKLLFDSIRLARTRMNPTEENLRAVEDILSRSTGTPMSRTGALVAVSTILTDPVEADQTSALNALEELKIREKEFTTVKKQAREILSSVEIPAHISLLSIKLDRRVPKERETDMNVIVGNVGDGVSRDVSVTVDAPIELGGSKMKTIGKLESREQSAVTFNLECEKSGQFEIPVESTSDSAGSDRMTVAVRVLTKVALMKTILEILSRLKQYIEENDSIKEGEQSLIRKLSTTRSRLEDATTAAENNKEKRANNLLNAADKTMQAFVEQVQTISEKGNDDRNAQSENGRNESEDEVRDAVTYTLLENARMVKDEISAARTAGI